MHKLNRFDQLSPEDRTFVLDLCARHTYHKAAEILAEPRPTGLGLTTSAAALCRFNTRHQPDAAATILLGQYARGIQIRHQSDGAGNLEAILALTENRLLHALQEGQPLAELSTEYRQLATIHRLFLAHDKWRGKKGPQAAEAEYRKYILESAATPEADYIRNDVDQAADDPGAGGADYHHFMDPEKEEFDTTVMAPMWDPKLKGTRPQPQTKTAQPEIPPAAARKTPVIPQIPQIPPPENSILLDPMRDPIPTRLLDNCPPELRHLIDELDPATRNGLLLEIQKAAAAARPESPSSPGSSAALACNPQTLSAPFDQAGPDLGQMSCGGK